MKKKLFYILSICSFSLLVAQFVVKKESVATRASSSRKKLKDEGIDLSIRVSDEQPALLRAIGHLTRTAADVQEHINYNLISMINGDKTSLLYTKDKEKLQKHNQALEEAKQIFRDIEKYLESKSNALDKLISSL